MLLASALPLSSETLCSGTSMETADAHITDAMERLKEVFSEIPGTRLNVTDAARLSGLDRVVCEPTLAALEEARFLRRGHDGLYQQRASDSPHS